MLQFSNANFQRSKASLHKLCYSYPTMMKAAIQKIYKSHESSLEFCWHQHFFTRNQQFFDIKKYRYWLYFSTWFLILLTIFGCNFDDVAKLTPLGLLKIKVFWNQGYYVISSVLDVTIKILLRNSNHIVHVVISLAALAFLWEKLSKPQFCKASIWKTNFLEGCWWFKLNN